jgi:glutathione transport system substrate-binding protein
MARKRRAAAAALIAASMSTLTVAGGGAASTEPPGDSPACPEAAVPATAPPTSAAAAGTSPATTEAAAPAATEAAAETTAPASTAPPPTLPPNVTELDPNVTVNVNEQPRDGLQQGGEVRLDTGSLAENWNPNHPDGNDNDFTRMRDPMSYLLWDFDGDGNPVLNTDYALDVSVEEDPFTVTYTLNPEAQWHDGTPITVADYEAEWRALNGTNAEFQVVATEGYDLISSVEQGADEFEVVVTFCQPYPDYEALFFLGGPAAAQADPETFNTGWLGPINNDWFTGPFELETYDDAQGIVSLVPSDTWWGDPALLDRITFRVVSPDAVPQAFANNELDAFDVGPDPNGYALSFSTPGAEIRAAAGPNWRHVTMNSGPNGGLIQDQAVRQAIQMSLDRAAIGSSDLAGIPWPAKPLNNHIFVENSPFYVDNAGQYGTYDPEAAIALLEENGWTAGADGVREKDGQRLSVRFSQITGVPVSLNEAQLVRNQLAEVGIEVELVDITPQEFPQVLSAGEFELIAFSWLGTQFPFRGVDQLYGDGSDSNYGFSTIPEITPLIDQLAVTEDDAERAAIANEIDVILWRIGHTAPLYQRPDLWAANAALANYGAFGLSYVQWEDVGWTG